MSEAVACKQCGCTRDNPCRLHTGDECVWLTDRCDVCSSPACVLAEDRRKREVRDAARRQKAELVQPIAERVRKGNRDKVAQQMRRAKRRANRRAA